MLLGHKRDNMILLDNTIKIKIVVMLLFIYFYFLIILRKRESKSFVELNRHNTK
jgi:ascorbate-specific PTS system EIIC-type component UlaA